MRPVIQQEKTGCAIASAASIAGVSYFEAKKVANGLGLFSDDKSLWSETQYILKLLTELGVETEMDKKDFSTWHNLPDCALLAIKWHKVKGKPFWHWAVFVRDGEDEFVWDSNKSLKSNIRKDFGRIHPRWYIKVNLIYPSDVPA